MSGAAEKIAGDFLAAMEEQLMKAIIPKAVDQLKAEFKAALECTTMNTDQAAKYIGVHPDTLREMCRKRQVPFSQMRREYHFRKKSLDAWLDEQEKANYQTVPLRVAK